MPGLAMELPLQQEVTAAVTVDVRSCAALVTMILDMAEAVAGLPVVEAVTALLAVPASTSTVTSRVMPTATVERTSR